MRVEDDTDHVFWKASQSRCDALNKLIREAEEPKSKGIFSAYSSAFSFDIPSDHASTYLPPQANHASSSKARSSRPRPMRNRQQESSAIPQSESQSSTFSQPTDTSALMDLIKIVSRKVDENSENKRSYMEQARRKALMKQRELKEQRQRVDGGKRMRRYISTEKESRDVSLQYETPQRDVDTHTESIEMPNLHSAAERSPTDTVISGIRDITMAKSPVLATSSSQSKYSQPSNRYEEPQRYAPPEPSFASISDNGHKSLNSSQQKYVSPPLKVVNEFVNKNASQDAIEPQITAQLTRREGGSLEKVDKDAADTTVDSGYIGTTKANSNTSKTPILNQQFSSSQSAIPKFRSGPPVLGMRRAYNSVPPNNASDAASSSQATSAMPMHWSPDFS